MLPNYNSNLVVLIPKVAEAERIDQYRPIALANFKYKIISKILADRLAKVAPTIVFHNQRDFIQGRQITDCIYLTSEDINYCGIKRYNF